MTVAVEGLMSLLYTYTCPQDSSYCSSRRVNVPIGTPTSALRTQATVAVEGLMSLLVHLHVPSGLKLL